MRLVLATRNPHKQREFARLMPGQDVEDLPETVLLPPEEASTFAENALVKARAAARGTRRPAVADDSGIEAEALDGAPGVRSARYAGEGATDAENLAKLMREVPAGSPLTYVCAVAFVDPATGEERLFYGRCRGRLSPEARGRGGFGYDPAFLPEDAAPGATMAELSSPAKDAISHRGRAVRELVRWLAEREG